MRNLLILMFSVVTLNVSGQIPTDGLVGYWPFNGNAKEDNGKGLDGVVNGAVLTTDRFEKANSAYWFNGVDQNIILTNTENLHLQGGFTLAAWVQLNDCNNGHAVVSKHENYYANGYNLVASYNKAHVITDVANYDLSTEETYNDGNWHFFVGTFDQSNLSIYVDGVLKKTMPAQYLTTNNQNIRIGSDTHISFYKGKIDDVRIYNRAVSQADVKAMYMEFVCENTITVTDALIINLDILHFNPVTYKHTIKIYPNPTNGLLEIDFGDHFNLLEGYTLRVVDTLGKEVYVTPVMSNKITVDLKTWTGKGNYIVSIINKDQIQLVNRKIILQ